MKLPLSVVIPVYNAAPFLYRCLDSVLGQTCQVEAVICVDDGSTDESLDILREYERIYESVHVIHKENGGHTSARKTGLKYVVTPYTTFADADDWIEPEMYETLMDAVLRYDADIVSSGYFRDFDHRQEIMRNAIVPGVYTGEKLLWLKQQVFPTDGTGRWRWDLLLWDKIFRTDLVRACQRDVDESIRFGEDNAVVWPALLQADAVVETGRAFYHYCWHEDSVMEQMDEQTDRASFNALLSYLSSKLLPMYDQVGNIADQLRVFVAGHLYTNGQWETCAELYGDVLKPFGVLPGDARIALYGAGKFGRKLKAYLEEHGYDVILWVDQTQINEHVQRPSALLHVDYDILLIGVWKWKALSDIEQKLIALGVPKERIRRVTMERILE